MNVDDGYLRRKAVDRIVRTACGVATLLAVVALVAILGYIVSRGARSLSLSFFTEIPKPPGESGGGMANALVGTLTLVGIATAIGVPLGIMSGIYLAEFGPSRLSTVVRFCADVLGGVPSIVCGLFVYSIVVVPMGGKSGIAGGLALALLMFPTVTRTTEELLKLVPNALREAALALGVPKWRAILRVLVPTAGPGIATGVVLAIARVTGETAPLLFTAGSNNGWATSPLEPTPSLTFMIFDYAGSPYEDQQQLAWAAALVLVGVVLILNISARLLVRRRASAAT